MRRLLFLLLTACTPSSVSAVDADFLRSWESAQKARPASVESVARIAPQSESGKPMTIHGRVVGKDGAPLESAVVFAWQTDANGVYDRPGAAPHSWRLRGWARTTAAGAFTFDTIRPAAYPNARGPAHVHFTLETANGERFFADDLNFADDPLLALDPGATKPAKVTERDGRQHVNVTLRLDPSKRF